MEESKLNEKNAERNSKKKTIIIILLIIIIILLLLFFLIRRFGFICLKDPTGNVDIFDINFVFQDNDDNDKCCCCSCCDDGICTCNHENTSNGNNTSCCNDSENCNIANNTETNQTNTNTQNGNLIVYDNEQMYTKQTELNIFTHKSWNVLEDKIAPETENSYQFIIRNNNDFNLKYSLTITEENPYNINMKFRLKMNGNYIVGNDSTWVTAEELINNGITINANTYDTYTLDWKWFESDNDTEIGENIESNYKLFIDIYANEV